MKRMALFFLALSGLAALTAAGLYLYFAKVAQGDPAFSRWDLYFALYLHVLPLLAAAVTAVLISALLTLLRFFLKNRALTNRTF